MQEKPKTGLWRNNPETPEGKYLELDEFGHGCRVWLGDQEVSSLLRGIEIEANVGALTRVTLHAIPRNIRIHGAPGKLQALEEVIDPPPPAWGAWLRRSWRLFVRRMHRGIEEAA